MLNIDEFDRISISSEARSKQQHAEEAKRIVRLNWKYRKDPNYDIFLRETIVGLCRGCSSREIFNMIRLLQKTIKPRVQGLDEDSFLAQ